MEKCRIDDLSVRAYRVPTEQPESDGTLAWSATTLVAVHAGGGGKTGFGYSYTGAGAAALIRDHLTERVLGENALDLPRSWYRMTAAVRNLGERGVARMAVAAVDAALWDLKAKILGLPLALLLGRCRDAVPIYASGGFTSYSEKELRRQLGGWRNLGISRVKIKIGRDPRADPARLRAARDVIGPQAELFVDANGAYTPAEALAVAGVLAEHGVTWFEEPVPQGDREGLRRVRDRLPPGIALASGEYCFTPDDFRQLLAGGAVDVLMADATRCGVTGYLGAAYLCEAFHVPLSSHCAPGLHLHPSCALESVRHMEYFHDHARVEGLLMDGVPEPVGGSLAPDLSRPGHGLELKEADARRYEIR